MKAAISPPSLDFGYRFVVFRSGRSNHVTTLQGDGVCGEPALNQEETASAVVVTLIDSDNQSYDVPAEDVRLNSNTGFAQVTFRLPDTLFLGS